MAWIIFWVICGVLTSITASNKGRDGVGWFIIGVLLGPLGFLISLVVSKNDEVVEQKSISTGTTKKCPFCAELVKKEALICKHCKSDLSKSKITNTQPIANETPSKVASKLKSYMLDNNLDEVKNLLSKKPDLSEFKKELIEFALFMEPDMKDLITGYFNE